MLMLFGLNRVTGLAGSLLLNLEAPFTVLLAVALFRQHLGRYAAAAVVMIVAGAAVLKLEPGALGADTLGIVLVAAACACWALDNNLTQKLSLRDPFAIVRVKALVAGVTNTVEEAGVRVTRTAAGRHPDRLRRREVRARVTARRFACVASLPAEGLWATRRLERAPAANVAAPAALGHRVRSGTARIRESVPARQA